MAQKASAKRLKEVKCACDGFPYGHGIEHIDAYAARDMYYLALVYHLRDGLNVQDAALKAYRKIFRHEKVAGA